MAYPKSRIINNHNSSEVLIMAIPRYGARDPYIRRKRHLENERPDGNLYYARLNTDFGLMYKIGVTSLPTLKGRLEFEGPLEGVTIERVFLFSYRANASEIEHKLHSACFSNLRLFAEHSSPNYPLWRNGQSELYAYDVLGLDPYFRDAQKEETSLRLEFEREGLRGSFQSRVESYIFSIKLQVAGSILLIPLAAVFDLIALALSSLKKNECSGKKEESSERSSWQKYYGSEDYNDEMFTDFLASSNLTESESRRCKTMRFVNDMASEAMLIEKEVGLTLSILESIKKLREKIAKFTDTSEGSLSAKMSKVYEKRILKEEREHQELMEYFSANDR